jgi:hypothetical protein
MVRAPGLPGSRAPGFLGEHPSIDVVGDEVEFVDAQDPLATLEEPEVDEDDAFDGDDGLSGPCQGSPGTASWSSRA